MIEHHSDTWPERHWAVERNHAKPGVTVHFFACEAARDRWVATNPHLRRAVGMRHPAVKALRQQWRAKALSKLRAWKERHR